MITEKFENRVRFFILTNDAGQEVGTCYGDSIAADDLARKLGVSREWGKPVNAPEVKASKNAEPARGVPTRHHGGWGVSGVGPCGLAGTSGVLDGLSEPETESKEQTKDKEVQIVNCTPHPIVVELPDGSRKTFEPSGTIPRVTSSARELDPIAGIPISETILGEVENLPELRPNVWLIVSSFVQDAAPGRSDLLRPDTGPDCIRDEKGQIIAVRRLTPITQQKPLEKYDAWFWFYSPENPDLFWDYEITPSSTDTDLSLLAIKAVNDAKNRGVELFGCLEMFTAFRDMLYHDEKHQED